MTDFSFETCEIEGVKLITPFFAEDERGFFLKNYEKSIFEKNGIKTDICETFESWSKKGVIRGLHFQTENPQSKIVRCVEGAVWDVVVDIRKNSPTKGKWRGFYLEADNNLSLYIPAGCAHGFLSLSEYSRITYICSGKYSSGTDSGIIWNDKTLNIDWPVSKKQNILLSKRDNKLQSYCDFLKVTNGGL